MVPSGSLSLASSVAAAIVRLAPAATLKPLSFAAIGASFTGVTVKRKSSNADAVPSFAVTRTSIKPLKLSGGVPVKRPVVALKLSQVGNTAPPANAVV